MLSTHILGDGCTWKKLCDWLGDREVFFCEEKDNVFSSSTNKMLECFESLHYVDGIVFWKLRNNVEEIGMIDVFGSFFDMDLSLHNNKMGVFLVEENVEDCMVEQWKTVPFGWWNNNKNSPQIKELCESF